MPSGRLMTRILYLVRHAKSSWTDTNLNDVDRLLNKRGHRDASDMGDRLSKRKVHPDLLLSSPARRALSTAEIIAEKIGLSAAAVTCNENIYAASRQALLQIVRGLPDRHASVMLCGHNPSLENLVNLLSSIPINHMPTCAVATLELAVGRWEETGRHSGRLMDFDYPKREWISPG